jgi:signal transduction histidine kinase
VSDLRPAGWVVASKPVNGPDGALEGVVVTASSVDSAVAILTATRDRLWVAFWVSLAIAGLLGFGFSELIGRRIRAMSAAAAAMAAGDFEQRISPGIVPDEVEELAVSYNSMAASLGEAFDAQRRFVADASHEMRTPIAALKGMLELLVDGANDVPEVRDDFMRTMQFEVDRLGRLVADLLTLAQLEAGSLRVAPAPESAAELFGGVARVLQALAEQAGVRLSVEIADADVRVLADRDRIVQVLLSFTDNAIKHSPRNTTVRLRAERHEDAVRLEVADEGPGIGAEELSRVFERFYRSDTARAGGGAGLGLAIAKEIVEAHGSSIDVLSTPGVGTTFGFELPSA